MFARPNYFNVSHSKQSSVNFFFEEDQIGRETSSYQ
jgi:hypothetical protein